MKLITFCSAALLLSGCRSTIYLVRHADKQAADQAMTTGDPALSEAGKMRAKALADSVTGTRLNAVFATPYLRTQQTAQATASIMARPVTVYQIAGGNGLIDSLARQKNRNFLVVGHSNTVPDMLRHVGLQPSMTIIDEADYDNLFVVRIKWWLGRKMTLREKTYGKPSP
jgi:phosphohistidine phosphatase SixA